MSQENVEIVRSMLEAAFKRGDPEAALSCFCEDVVFHPLVAGPYHGRAGVAEQMLVWVAEFDDYWYEVDELIDAGEGVVVFWRHGGVGKTSGIPTEAEGGAFFKLDGAGTISHAWVFADRADALEAAGLPADR
jgi:ketosteroid isomerase-like protein